MVKYIMELLTRKCPFCCTDIDLLDIIVDGEMTNEYTAYIECYNCGMTGPKATGLYETRLDARSEAIQQWETRGNVTNERDVSINAITSMLRYIADLVEGMR